MRIWAQFSLYIYLVKLNLFVQHVGFPAVPMGRGDPRGRRDQVLSRLRLLRQDGGHWTGHQLRIPRFKTNIKKDFSLKVSWDRGTPKSSILVGFSLTNQPFWDPHVWKPICCARMCGRDLCDGVKCGRFTYYCGKCLGENLNRWFRWTSAKIWWFFYVV